MGSKTKQSPVPANSQPACNPTWKPKPRAAPGCAHQEPPSWGSHCLQCPVPERVPALALTYYSHTIQGKILGRLSCNNDHSNLTFLHAPQQSEFSEPTEGGGEPLGKRLSMFYSFPNPSQERSGILLPLLAAPDNLFISDTSPCSKVLEREHFRKDVCCPKHVSHPVF